jgi:general secretion pathway protein G
MQLRKYQARNRGGFTLMELLVVVAILVVLAGAAVPIYMKYLDDAKRSMAWSNAKMLAEVCETYKIKTGEYPVNLQELVTPPDGKPYIEPQFLLDPYGHDYQYVVPGSHGNTGKPDIWSNGANANDGQIGNWLLKPP